MKNRLWMLQIPFVILFTGAFLLSDRALEGDVKSELLRDTVLNILRRPGYFLTDMKFRARGTRDPQHKIVVVEVDETSVQTLQRWPWHRDLTAKLIRKTFDAGAKVVGLDVVFSEPDVRVPEDLHKILDGLHLDAVANQYETDLELMKTVHDYGDRLVLGWTADGRCIPAYDPEERCPVTNPEALASFPEDFSKYALDETNVATGFDPTRTPIQSAFTPLNNYVGFHQFARHAGYFDAIFDYDGYIRRAALVMLSNRKAYPSLPLAVAKVGMGEKLAVDLDAAGKVKSLRFANSGRPIDVSSMGSMQINFRGKPRTFTYISAADVLDDSDVIKDELNKNGGYRTIAGLSKKDVLRDAYVFIGVSAIGAHDIRSFPFEAGAPGVDGHANILDNLLTGDALVSAKGIFDSRFLAVLMTVGALLFAVAVQRLDAVPALLLSVFVLGGLGFGDFKFLFAHENVNLDTSFLYLEIFTIFLCTVAAKYVMEERSKKFVKGAFAKYVAPAVVDSIMKDPSKLVVGGEKRELTIMFSDIRSFTTFSEKMDAKALSSFLNDYLGIMTEIVFRHSGTLDKYIGDAVMAFWGAPLEDPKHAQNATNAVKEMMKALADNKERFRTQYGVDVNVGIGYNSGTVSVGNMGSPNNFSYTVIGDNVNLASRMEGLTKEYGVSIVTSRFSFDAIEKAGLKLPEHRVLDHVKVKGKKKAVELIQVLEKPLPEEGLRLFDEGRALYASQKWDEAIASFRAAHEILAAAQGGNDGPSRMYVERCEEFKKNPPEAGWDGSWKMDHK